MKRIDALIIGLCIIAAAVILGSILRTPSEETGRYQFSDTSGVTVFILDTKTGKIWSKFVNRTSGPTDWDAETGPWMEE